MLKSNYFTRQFYRSSFLHAAVGRGLDFASSSTRNTEAGNNHIRKTHQRTHTISQTANVKSNRNATTSSSSQLSFSTLITRLFNFSSERSNSLPPEENIATKKTVSETHEPQQQQEHRNTGDSTADTTAVSATASAPVEGAKSKNQDGAENKALLKLYPVDVIDSWKDTQGWQEMGDEFKEIPEDRFLRPVPNGFLSPRVHDVGVNVQPAEELLHSMVDHMKETYKGIDVRNPNTIAEVDGEAPKGGPCPATVTFGQQVRNVSEFMSSHLAFHCTLEDWTTLFDLKRIELDVSYFLWVLHLHIISRRLTSVNIHSFSRRRELQQELLLTMFESWIGSAEHILGRPPLSKIRSYIRSLYYTVALNLEEALLHDGPGSDLALLAVFIKFLPVAHPEDVPMYTYYQLVHYFRFHSALLDRVSDEDVSIGNFHFLSPTDPLVFAPYDTIKLDEVIRSWKADDADIENS